MELELERFVSKSSGRYLITLPESLNATWEKLHGKKVRIKIVVEGDKNEQ